MNEAEKVEMKNKRSSIVVTKCSIDLKKKSIVYLVQSQMNGSQSQFPSVWSNRLSKMASEKRPADSLHLARKVVVFGMSKA